MKICLKLGHPRYSRDSEVPLDGLQIALAQLVGHVGRWGGGRGTGFIEIAKGGWARPSPLSGLRPCPSYAPGGRPGSSRAQTCRAGL